MVTAVTPHSGTVNRQYKSSIFAMLFSERKELLKLYNAVNGTSYTDPELLTVNTLENAIYMAVKNDVSFLIGTRLYLYEHQSTWNPNLPLRNLFYVSDLYSAITEERNLYSSKKIQIPAPHFLVFYNGEGKRPDQVVMKLSELYESAEETPELELIVHVLNINQGHNEELMKACQPLRDYAAYTAKVRENIKAGYPVREAVEQAVTGCIREGILEEFLRRNRSEAMKVSIYEYDAERHLRMEREEAYKDGQTDGYRDGQAEGYRDGQADGYQEGHRKGYQQGQKDLQKKFISVMLKKGKTITEIAADLDEDEQRIQELAEQFQIK